MKKIKNPNLKVIKFESMDVIATSAHVSYSKAVTIDNFNDVGTSWATVTDFNN